MFDPMWYNRPAGIPYNDAVTWIIRNNNTRPVEKTREIPQFLLGVERRPERRAHDCWNPVMWSDYPKQPAWTVPMPKIPGPMVTQRMQPLPTLPCHRPPSETLTPMSQPTWVPDAVPYDHNFNPFENDTNRPFGDLQGPSKTGGFHRFPSC